ncbi:uncharacterized protein F4822DRAFT_27367 [Hypoxylon trugodes]|uniref:uncharacterized protein n=1 Tax=Hypoxylon trugodes TaxID=326681 RepID=UPI0021921BAF|nr:uncharacterized protein F4822DRAFT_27367 [Hypoxylon trugodes]KAI1393842.1 hypothetical protein F4822DRAFT_27367 [Hypoxylon trugodes]
MSSGRALRGSCHCGRNQYIVQIPNGAFGDAQILFDSTVGHRISSATPLSAFLRIPLLWYHSQVFPFFPDESRTTIRRTYSHPAERNTIRHFCGFCGTPLSYWSEEPKSEAEFIQLTLGSLLTEDLNDLEELGLIPDESEQDPMDIVPVQASSRESRLIGRDTTCIPWFENMILGSRLGNIHTTKAVGESRDGRVRVEYEITEWAEDDAAGDEEAKVSEPTATGKRKRGEADEGDGNNTAHGTT